jgi:uncharacterized protein
MAESTLVLVATIAMLFAVGLSLVPVIPGPLLLWAIALFFGIAEGFQRLTPVGFAFITLIMLLGSASDLWLPLFGVKTGGMSCLSSLGAMIGGVAGSFLIPIPILGTLVGCVGGALLVEYLRSRDMDPALKAGRTAFNLYIISYGVQLAASILIFIVYVVTLLSTV